MAFQRRERPLIEIKRIRSNAFQIYLSHAIWDWPTASSGSGRDKAKINWLDHTDKVLEQLIGMGDELSRFLTLPTTSRTRHRLLNSGRREAARTVKVAYRLFDSLYTQRMIKLSHLSEKFRSLGLSASEMSRIRQYERFIGEAVEGLRMFKMYRTPQALRYAKLLYLFGCTVFTHFIFSNSTTSMNFRIKILHHTEIENVQYL